LKSNKDQYSKIYLLKSNMGDNVSIAVYYTMFSVSTKTTTFAKREVLVLYFVVFSLKIWVPSPEFLSSVLAKVCVRVCWQGGLPTRILNVKITYISGYFYQYPSHWMFVAQCSDIITHEIHFIWEPWLTGEIFTMKTMNLNSSVILI
jgi:hypothetical protein